VVTDDWPSAGTRLAFRYRLVARIQAGGMAVVWRARDELLGREVALKLLAGPLAGSRGVFDLVRREARAAARLSHPNVTAVHDYGEAVRPDGAVAPFVVMELLDGHMLAGRLERGPLPWPEAAAIGADIADGLAAIHRSGIVHRDVTPGNVMLTPGGVKVVDFGISAAIGEPDEDSSGSTFGTPAYVAPERLDGLPAVAATDVYALGALLFEMVTGAPPYPVGTWEELAAARQRPPAALPPGIPPAFAGLVTSCLAEEPDHRPHAGQVAAALRALSRQPRAGAPTTRPTATATATPTGPASRPAGLT
jgi:serine/threonine-protein kinase